MKFKFSKYIVIFSINIILLICFGELTLRILKRGRLSYSEYFTLMNNGHYAPSKNNGIKLISNYKGIQSNQDRNLNGEEEFVSVTTNADGSEQHDSEKCKSKIKKLSFF